MTTIIIFQKLDVKIYKVIFRTYKSQIRLNLEKFRQEKTASLSLNIRYGRMFQMNAVSFKQPTALVVGLNSSTSKSIDGFPWIIRKWIIITFINFLIFYLPSLRKWKEILNFTSILSSQFIKNLKCAKIRSYFQFNVNSRRTITAIVISKKLEGNNLEN